MGETLEEQQPVAAEVENQFLWARRTAGEGKVKKFFLCPSLPRSSSNNGLERTNRRIRVRRSGRARLERNFALSTSSSYCVLEVSFPPSSEKRTNPLDGKREGKERETAFIKTREGAPPTFPPSPPQKNNATCCRFPQLFRHYQGSPFFCWKRLGRKMDKRKEGKEGKPLFLVSFLALTFLLQPRSRHIPPGTKDPFIVSAIFFF